MLFVAGVLLAVSTMAQNSQADNPPGNVDKTHAVGLHYGKTTGKGLAYRYVHNRFAIQAAAWPIYNNAYEFDFNQGIAFLYRLHRNENINLYLYQGNQFTYEKWQAYKYYVNNGYYWRDLVIYEHAWYALSVGAALEIQAFDAFSLNLMWGYGCYENFAMTSIAWEIGLFYLLN
ncbi:MAG: hypothetical protein ACLFM1_08965 [Bacteroidales bacterium]